MDIETAADLTSKSWAKLAKAKSRGLTYILVMEAITTDKSWKEIKDFLWLKLCKLISIHIPHISWISNSGKRNLLQPMSIDSRLKPKDATSQMMLLPSESLSKD